jgi:predicted XRE-type DNA-binding protein
VVAEVSVYKVIVTREGHAWLADVPDVAGTHTWAKNLPGLDRNVREAIAVAHNLPEGAEADLKLSYEYHTGDPDLDTQTAALRAEREHLAEAETDLTERTAHLADQIVHQRGMSVRDAATLLHVSPQRISQVAPTRTAAKPADTTRPATSTLGGAT